MKKFKPAHQLLSPALAGLLLAMLFLGLASRPALADATAKWLDLGAPYDTSASNNICFDGNWPGRIAYTSTSLDKPTYAIFANQRNDALQFSSKPFYYCNEATGLFYAKASPDAKNGFSFNSNELGEKALTYTPTHFAVDGSLWVYALVYKSNLNDPRDLFASPDGGLTWQQRNISGLNAGILAMTVSASDGRALYALTQDTFGPNRRYTLSASTDAGSTWEKRSELTYQDSGSIFTPSLYFAEQPARTAPSTYLEMTRSAGAGSNGTSTRMLSTDGGRTFVDIGTDGRSGYNQIFYTDNGFVRLKQGDTGVDLSRSTDSGKTWQTLTLPFTPATYNPSTGGPNLVLRQAKNASANLFLSYGDGTTGDIWHSADGGRTWEDLASNMPQLMISPNAPTYLIGFKNNRIYLLNASSVDKTETKGVAFSAGPDASYFEATRHNLSGLFKKYWTDHGGLPQFGYPWTEPFREVNAETGKIYTVQYFERNRFEYHPEYAGTPYEVLLGLLGNNQTGTRRAEGPFVRFDDAHYPGGSYFSQTGHNLRNSFKAYWEANGSLAIYGYPISEEFEEVNPDDGKTYVVQYFERNRFEYHPENRGTKYEVLLGLLGNSLLKSKGWL